MEHENSEEGKTCWELEDSPYEPPTGRQAAPVTQWCGTAHHSGFTDGEPEAREEMLKIGADCKFFVAGNEVAPTTGSKHFQFYAHFRAAVRFTALKKKYHGSICWFQCKGSPQANLKYCTKDDKDAILIGELPPDNGRREFERHQAAKRAAIEGRLEDVDADIFIRNYGNLKRIKEDFAAEPEEIKGVCGIWIKGESGYGKSRLARTCKPELGPVFNKLVNKWWDHYKGERVVLLDEFRECHTYLLEHLCRWADLYAFPAEVKGGVRNFRPEFIIVTSQYSIEELWNTHQDVSAVRRRFEVWNMGEKYKVTNIEPRWKDGAHGAPVATVSTFVPGPPAATYVSVPATPVGTPQRPETPAPILKPLRLERQLTIKPKLTPQQVIKLLEEDDTSEDSSSDDDEEDECEKEVIDLTQDD